MHKFRGRLQHRRQPGGASGIGSISIDPRSPDAARGLGNLRPDVAIVDLTTAQSEPISLLRKYPELLLIGVDLNSDELVVLSGEPARPLTMDNLVHVIEAAALAWERNG